MKSFKAICFPLWVLFSHLSLQQEPFALLAPPGSLCNAKVGLRRECCMVVTSLEDGPGHLAGWCFSSAISGCKHLFFIKNSTGHLVAWMESAVKEWMRCNQCRWTLLSVQGTGSRCWGGRTGCSVLLSTVQGSCWTTNHWSLAGFPGQILLCACPVHFHTQSYWLVWKLGSQRTWDMALTEFLQWCLWKREEILLFTVTGTLCSRWQPELLFLPSHPSVHLSSLSTVLGFVWTPPSSFTR